MLYKTLFCGYMCKTFFIFASTNLFLINPERASPITLIYIRPMSTISEAYVHLSADQTTLTFYYDSFRADRYGTTWGIRDPKEDYYVWRPAWAGDYYTNTTVLTAIFDASFRDFCPTSTAEWFYDLKSLKNIEGFELLNTSQVTSMRHMFSGCSSLTSLELSSFDTSQVTDMREMFYCCESLTTLDLSSFNTSQVTAMEEMFYGCESLTSLDLTSFDTSQVTDMRNMFSGCSSLTSLDLTSFDTSQVTYMVGMFDDCSSLTALDLSSFNTSKVISMGWMFRGCLSLSTLDLSSFDTSEVTYMRKMFSSCSSLTSLDLSSFDTSQVTCMKGMFSHCSSLTTLDLTSFDTSQVTGMREMFSGCSSLTTILSFAFRNCLASEAMFHECFLLQGAVNFNEKYTNARMANSETGYFTKKEL